jgi:hypothetical protein
MWCVGNANTTRRANALPGIDAVTGQQIDRLRAVDYSHPRIDRTGVANALLRHLAALGLPPRPVIWTTCAEDGVDKAEQVEAEMAQPLVDELVAEAAANRGRAASPMSGGAWDAAIKLATSECAPCDLPIAAWEVDRRKATETTPGIWELARIATTPGEVACALGSARLAQQAAVTQASRDRELAAVQSAVRDAAAGALPYRAWALDQGINWIAEEHLSGNWSITPAFAQYNMETAAFGALDGFCALGCLATFDHPAMRRWAEIWAPLIDAFVAGLGLYWIAPSKIICVPVPAIHVDETGRLHRDDGPAVEWPGEKWYYSRGTVIPARFVEKRDEITVGEIKKQYNAELRRILCELYGWERFLRDAGAEKVHRDGFGTLWRVNDGGRETAMYVEVENATAENGRRRRFFLRVPPTMRTAHEAVAWTFGLTMGSYKPVEES